MHAPHHDTRQDAEITELRSTNASQLAVLAANEAGRCRNSVAVRVPSASVGGSSNSHGVGGGADAPGRPAEGGEELDFCCEEAAHYRAVAKDLRQRVIEMDHFLSDYGLVWVGDNSDLATPKQGLHQGHVNTIDRLLASPPQGPSASSPTARGGDGANILGGGGGSSPGGSRARQAHGGGSLLASVEDGAGDGEWNPQSSFAAPGSAPRGLLGQHGLQPAGMPGGGSGGSPKAHSPGKLNGVGNSHKPSSSQLSSGSPRSVSHGGGDGGGGGGGGGGGAPADAYQLDLRKLQACIDELNYLAGDGVSSIIIGKDGRKQLKAPDPLTLAVYSNGVVLGDGAFREYSTAPCRALLNDLLDGYFPLELKDKYPEGVPFRLEDKSHMAYSEPFKAFSGRGAVLADGRPPPVVAQPQSNVHGLRSGEGDGTPGTPSSPAPVSAEQFLHRLPKSVIKNGKVIEIRSEIETVIKGPKPTTNEIALIPTAMDGLNLQRPPVRRRSSFSAPQRVGAVSPTENGPTATTHAASDAARPGSRQGAAAEAPESGAHARPPSGKPGGGVAPHAESTMLKIKSEDGKTTYVLHMGYEETIGDVRRYLDGHLGTGYSSKYEIRTSFPNKVYADNTQTLRDAGLVPSATLFLRIAAAGTAG
eukprot:jgi/Mesvir1/27906/Mv03420-RA.1